ncbi:MAG: hypothetical protein JWO52_6569, partial [Gammaproteobacteria bacterium]|nr:hypothetical protein [Gammaproteobacteria bacterium]
GSGQLRQVGASVKCQGRDAHVDGFAAQVVSDFGNRGASREAPMSIKGNNGMR